MNEENVSNEALEQQQELTDAELQAVIKDAEELAEAQLRVAVEKVRALPALRVLTPRQFETLLSIKEEDLTLEDRRRLAWAKLRLPKTPYRGTDYTPAEKKKIKVKKKLVAQSRRANRGK